MFIFNQDVTKCKLCKKNIKEVSEKDICVIVNLNKGGASFNTGYNKSINIELYSMSNQDYAGSNVYVFCKECWKNIAGEEYT